MCGYETHFTRMLLLSPEQSTQSTQSTQYAEASKARTSATSILTCLMTAEAIVLRGKYCLDVAHEPDQVVPLSPGRNPELMR